MGFVSLVALILWPGFIAGGVLFTIGYTGPIGFLAFLAANFALAYSLNKARKHSRKEAFDDRLTQKRMDDASTWLIQTFKEVEKRDS